MTSLPPHDPLIALWQTAAKPDAQHLAQDLQRVDRLHRRLNQSVFAILCGIAILLIFEEATGRVASHGILSAIWILALITGVVWQRRARCSRADVLTLDTVRLLRFMIARAKRDLHLARCLYAGVPCGALAGYVAIKITGLGASTADAAAHPTLHLIQTAAGVAALIIMVTAGAILSRSRSLQVQELSEKLRAIEADL